MFLRLLYISGLAALTTLVFFVYLHQPGVNGNERSRISDMVRGIAHKPFVNRALLPATARIIVAAIPSSARLRIDAAVGDSALGRDLFDLFNLDLRDATVSVVVVVLMYAALWGFVWAFGDLVKGLYDLRDGVRNLLTLAAVAGLLQMIGFFNYLYDFSTLFLFTWCLALLARGKWGLYLGVFAAACLNKETTILLVLIFVLLGRGTRRLPRFIYWRLLAAQLAIYAAARTVLTIAFWHNPGPPAEFHFLDHNMALLKLGPASALFGWIGLWLLVFYGWSSKPALLRAGLWIVPPLVVLALLFGYLDELRDYYEAYPIVLLLAADGVARLLRRSLTLVNAARG